MSKEVIPSAPTPVIVFDLDFKMSLNDHLFNVVRVYGKSTRSEFGDRKNPDLGRGQLKLTKWREGATKCRINAVDLKNCRSGNHVSLILL